MRIQCISRLSAISRLPTTGTLFSLVQATTHALQPMHAFMSTAMPHACGSLNAVGAPGYAGGFVYGGSKSWSRVLPSPLGWADAGLILYSVSVVSRTSGPL